MEKKVLVVDNNPVIIKLVSHMIEKMGNVVETAPDGLSALEVLSDFTPDVIFTDLIMPNIGGIELCRAIRKQSEFDKTYLVVLSAVAVEKELNFTDFGADACIAKGPAREMQIHIEEIFSHLDEHGFKPLDWKILGSGQHSERQITKELLEQKNYLEVILDQLEAGVFELSKTGKIIFANKAAGAFFGLSIPLLLGTFLKDYFSKKDQARINKAINDIGDSPLVIGRDDALKLHARYLTAKLIPLGFRRSQQVLILFNDITRQKQARDELDEHMLRLEEKVSHKTARYKEIHLEFQKELAYRKKIQRDLESALEQVKQLRGLLPICASCKNIRDDNGYWSQIEGYIEKHSDVTFTHGLCPDCGKKLYPELFDTDIEEP